MKKIAQIQIVFLLLACTFLASCSKEEAQSDEETKAKTCKMVFNGSISGFDGTTLKSADTKAGTTSWNEGDKVYIAFHKGSSIIAGIATYTSGAWAIDFDGLLSQGTNQSCEVRYFTNATEESQYTVNLNANTGIYETLDGIYSYDGETVSVTATMSPKTGRIRFSGNSGDVIYVKGITTYKTFSATNCKFYTTEQMIKRTVDTDYTPYIYGYFTDESPLLYIVEKDQAYTRSCSSSIFKTGESGYMTIPSESSHSKWQKGVILDIDGVNYRMLSVNSTSYLFQLLGETEVTASFYNAVISESASSSMLPYECSYSNWSDFVKTLETKTNMKFLIPDSYLWRCAANGGALSHNYIYSGSNDADEVAWYASNSNNTLHEVKQLMPNELGFYDMSGNADEYTLYTYQSYSPYFYYYRYGGDYASDISSIQTNSYNFTSGSSGGSTSHGFRPAMDCSTYIE